MLDSESAFGIALRLLQSKALLVARGGKYVEAHEFEKTGNASWLDREHRLARFKQLP